MPPTPTAKLAPVVLPVTFPIIVTVCGLGPAKMTAYPPVAYD